MAVVKADAYGHGLGAVCVALRDLVKWFCVANIQEAILIREALPELCPPILILSPITPEEIDLALVGGFSCSVSSLQEVDRLGDRAEKMGKIAHLHAVADTGMGRMGVAPAGWKRLLDAIHTHPHCELEGVSTHFPNADEDAAFTKRQIDQFREMTRGLTCQIHLANSAGLIDFSPEIEFATLSRPGLALYGVSPQCVSSIALRPVLAMKSRVTLVREISPGTTISYGSTYRAASQMLVASLAVGYADGYPRHLSGRDAAILISGKRCPILGRITMDQIVVDVSALPRVEPGAEAVLIGEQGGEVITAIEIATKASTIPWEILTGITKRVERVYF
jgi:alanine racemase